MNTPLTMKSLLDRGFVKITDEFFKYDDGDGCYPVKHDALKLRVYPEYTNEMGNVKWRYNNSPLCSSIFPKSIEELDIFMSYMNLKCKG